jgi:carboxypeptidase PM20D1
MHGMSRVMRWVKRSLGVALLASVVLATVLVIRTARLTSGQIHVPPGRALAVDEPAAAGRLAGAVRIETVTHAGAGNSEVGKFTRLIEYLHETFPSVDKGLTWEVINGGSLLLTWEGRDKALDPLLLLAHMDVVPAEEEATETPSKRVVNDKDKDQDAGATAGKTPWGELAFQGRVEGSFVWGRGTLDDKVSVVGILEAIEALIKEGYRPGRTVLLAFGRDEEVGGSEGAAKLAGLLRGRGVRPECVLDEGSFVLEKVVPGVVAPVAPVGIAEKGYADVELSVEAAGGHSSQPPAHTAIGVLSRAVARLEDHPYPARIDGVVGETLRGLGPEMPYAGRLAVANLWLFGPLVTRGLASSASTNALIRTTAAVTLVRGGTKDNVLPGSAAAIVNFRLLPGDTSAGLLAHVTRAVADPAVKVRFADPARYSRVFEPSHVSPTDSQAYDRLRRAIRQTFPDAVVVPYVTVGGTDARRYEGLTRNVFRFLPVRLVGDDLKRIHGRYERVSLKNYGEAVRFYANLIRQFD